MESASLFERSVYESRPTGVSLDLAPHFRLDIGIGSTL